MKNYIKKPSILLGFVIFILSCNDNGLGSEYQAKLSASQGKGNTLKERQALLASKKQELADYTSATSRFRQTAENRLGQVETAADSYNKVINGLETIIKRLGAEKKNFESGDYLKNKLAEIDKNLG